MTAPTTPAMVPDVAAAFARCPTAARERLLAVRQLIFETAAATDGVGTLTETYPLKWGEPAYLTEASRSGSTVRLGWKRSSPERCAVYFNCRTTLVATFRTMFSGKFDFEQNRAILLDPVGPFPEKPLAMCFSMALTYHRRKR